MKYIITGSLGLVGLSASTRLLSEGNTVVGIDCDARKEFFGENGSNSNKISFLKDYKNYQHYNVDITNLKEVEKIFSEGFDRVIHAAAQPSHDWATSNIIRDFNINAVASLNIFDCVLNVNKNAPIVYISTNKVYGDNPNKLQLNIQDKRFDLDEDNFYYNGISETFSVDNCLHSFFGCSKLSADLYAQEYGKHTNLKIGIFRPGCITGLNHSGVPLHGFLSYLTKCIKNDIEYKIIGYEGYQVRDNTHVDDLVDACLFFLDNPTCGEVYNVGGRNLSCSILEAIEKIEKITGKTAKISYVDEPRTGDHKWCISDMSKFKSKYNWKNKKTLQDIFEELCQ